MSEISEPLHPDFQKILRQFKKRYGDKQGTSYFYAWVRKMGLDDTKPYGREAFESYNWAQDEINYWKQTKDAKFYKVDALFPLSSMNNNVYVEDELIRAGRTLAGKPVNINHDSIPIVGVEIIDSEYEDGAEECIIRVANTAICPYSKSAPEYEGQNINRLIADEKIPQVSIEIPKDYYRRLEPHPEGTKIVGFRFGGLGMLTKNVLPGVPLTRIMPVETMAERIVERFDKKRRIKLIIKI